MKHQFTFYHPTRIHFGVDTINNLGDLAAAYGKSCLLVTTSNAETVLSPLYGRAIAILAKSGVRAVHFDEVVPNPTVQSIEKAIRIVRQQGLEMVVALGGGSSIDTAKAIALFHQVEAIDWADAYERYISPFKAYEAVSTPVLPLIAVPTTAGTGSELTHAMVISDETTEEKVCIFHDHVFPRHAVIDPALTLSMPPRLTAITGFDAFSHAFESFLRDEASAYTQLLAGQAIRNILFALPKLMDDPGNLQLRIIMSEAEMFAGISLSNAAATVPHPLSEVIGGIAPRIPHGQALASLYPGFVRFQILKTPEKCAELARMFKPSLQNASVETAAAALPGLVETFLHAIRLDQTLSQLGISKEEQEKLSGHFLLGVLPFGTREELTAVMRAAF